MSEDLNATLREIAVSQAATAQAVRDLTREVREGFSRGRVAFAGQDARLTKLEHAHTRMRTIFRSLMALVGSAGLVGLYQGVSQWLSR